MPIVTRYHSCGVVFVATKKHGYCVVQIGCGVRILGMENNKKMMVIDNVFSTERMISGTLMDIRVIQLKLNVVDSMPYTGSGLCSTQRVIMPHFSLL